jgi:hypothetical protein
MNCTNHADPVGKIRTDAVCVSLFSLGVRLAPQCPVHSVDALDCTPPKRVHGFDMAQVPPMRFPQ